MSGMMAEKAGKKTELFEIKEGSVNRLIAKKRNEDLKQILDLNPPEDLKTRAEAAMEKFEIIMMALIGTHTMAEMKQIELEAAKQVLEMRAIRQLAERKAAEREAAREAAREAQAKGLKAGVAPKLQEKWVEGSLTFESRDSETVSSVMDLKGKWKAIFNEDGTVTVRTRLGGEAKLRGDEVLTKKYSITDDEARKAKEGALKILGERGLEPAGRKEPEWREPATTG